MLAREQTAEGCFKGSYPSKEDVGKDTDDCRAEGRSDGSVGNHRVRELTVRSPRPSRVVTITWQLYRDT